MKDYILFDYKIPGTIVPKSPGFEDIINIKNSKRHVIGNNEKAIQKALKDKNTLMLISPELSVEKDSIHQINSGLNQVLCREARENSIIICFGLSFLLNSQNPSKLLGRMLQNIRLCKKYKVKICIASLANNENELRTADELKAFGRFLGI